MSYNRAVNIKEFAYHYFTIRPGLFEARVFVSVKIRSNLFYFSLGFGELSGLNLVIKNPAVDLVK
jgi:hypothetical protein